MALDVLPQSELKMSGKSQVLGDAAIMACDNAKLSGNSLIAGTLFLEPGVNLSLKGKTHAGTTKTNADLSALEKQINDLNAADTHLQPTQAFGDVKRSLRIQGNGKLNVIEIDGDIHLSGKRAIQLEGQASDVFVLNVLGKVELSGSSSIRADGGTLPGNIFIHVLGHEEGHHHCTEGRHGRDFHLSGGSAVDGNVFVFEGKSHLSEKAAIRGALLVSGKVHLSGQSHVDGYGKCYAPPPVPDKDKDKDKDKGDKDEDCGQDDHGHDDWNKNEDNDDRAGQRDDDNDNQGCDSDEEDDDWR